MWTQDFCTVCDKQCVQGAVYCSETCRLEEKSKRAPVEHTHCTHEDASRAFLYESPLLKPQSGAGSPPAMMAPVSPLLIGQDPGAEELPASNYRRWLVESTPAQLHT